METRLCALERVAGRTVECSESRCPFWEPGGAVLPGRCGFEGIDLSSWPAAAGELLHIRELLEAPGAADADRQARHLLHRLLNQSEAE